MVFQAHEPHSLQIRIRVEHTIGLLKGTFQSLKEIRIQLNDSRHHKIVVIWARVCIILHNLVIRIEGDNFDEAWRDGIMHSADEHDGLDDSDEDDALEEVQHRLETPAQRFRLKLMDDLFNSPSRNIARRP